MSEQEKEPVVVDYFEFRVERKSDGRIYFSSKGDGMTTMEVIGFLHWKLDDVLKQFQGQIQPEQIQRVRVERGKE